MHQSIHAFVLVCMCAQGPQTILLCKSSTSRNTLECIVLCVGVVKELCTRQTTRCARMQAQEARREGGRKGGLVEESEAQGGDGMAGHRGCKLSVEDSKLDMAPHCTTCHHTPPP